MRSAGSPGGGRRTHGEAIADGSERAAAANVAGMKTPAFVFDRRDERVERTPDADVRRHQRRLYVTNPIDQHLPVVPPPEDVLVAPQEPDRPGHPFVAADFVRELDGIA